MSFTGLELKRIVEPGAMRVAVGVSSEDLPLQQNFCLVGDIREISEGRTLLPTIAIG